MAKEKYMSTFIANQLISTPTVALTAGIPVKIGEYLVKAGMEIALGYGAYDDLERAVGRIYALFKDTTAVPVVIAGTMRLSVWSPQDRPLEILYEARTEISGSSAVRNQQQPLPEHSVNLQEDRKLVLEFIADANATLSRANSSLFIDHTVYVV